MLFATTIRRSVGKSISATCRLLWRSGARRSLDRGDPRTARRNVLRPDPGRGDRQCRAPRHRGHCRPPTVSFRHLHSEFPSASRMSNWPASKASRVFAALERIGWRVKRQRGSHRLLTRPGWPDYELAFHDQDEIGRRMSARVAKRTGLKPEDLGSSTSVKA
jgi:predicted RNA binding protein YcfA (HicA-like mRNA interferase family)